jgi:hypothetical protein
MEPRERVMAIEAAHLLPSLRASDFDLPSAIGELIDNSIEAEAKHIKIKITDAHAGEIKKTKVITKIICGDDGIGMDDYVLHNCIRLGYSTRYDNRYGIGRFGVGMTLAGIRFATKIEVFSKQKRGVWKYISFDLNNEEDIKEGILKPIEKKIPKEYESFTGKDQGTLVIWSGFDQVDLEDIHTDEWSDREKGRDSLDPYGLLNHWIGRTFRTFISKGVIINLNDNIVYSFDPLYLNKEKNQFPKDPKAEILWHGEIEWPIPESVAKVNPKTKNSKIKIVFSLLPEFYRKTEKRGGLDFPGRYIDENEGVSILRNGREVAFGAIPYFLKLENVDRWWGCEISFDPVLDECFTVKHIKRGAIPIKSLKEAILQKIKGPKNTAREIVRDLWAKNKLKEESKKKADGLPDLHPEAENLAKSVPLADKIKAGLNLSRDETEKRISDATINALDRSEEAKWKARFQAQPYTIMDAAWKGDTFIETSFFSGKAVLQYNINHTLFKEITQIREQLKELKDSKESSKLAHRIKVLMDILLMSFARARQSIDEDQVISAKTLLDYIVKDWGRFLETYIEAYKKEKSYSEQE